MEIDQGGGDIHMAEEFFEGDNVTVPISSRWV